MVARVGDEVLSKQCEACGLSLPLARFTPSKKCRLGVLPRCRACQRARSAAYREKRPDVHRKASMKWRLANPEKQRAACKDHYRRNKDSYRKNHVVWQANNPGKAAAYNAAHAGRHPERRRESWRSFYHRTKHKPLHVIRRRITSRMHAHLNGQRHGFISEVGCSPDCLRAHLELLFPEGMGWHNASEWEIDHFYPLSAVGEGADWLSVAAVCNYRNLRPCWRAANRSKRAFVLPEAERLFGAIKQMIAEGKA